ncbi:unnamed protein product [Parnassius mnemosyne]|uniref:Uncharacterized protein n=1 Tax=Parnassius mnemosyne TaxID=213953 RepID=A0AAV1M391_9NEOP
MCGPHINFGLNLVAFFQGPYDLNWSRYEICSGPKLKNLTFFSTTLVKEGDSYVSQFNCTLLAPARIDEIKIIVHTVKDNRTSLLWSYKVNNPCQHYAVASFIEKYAKNCVLKQGNYYSMVNFTELSYMFFGSSFFYGEYKMKVIILSKNGNIVCLIMNSIFNKRKAP